MDLHEPRLLIERIWSSCSRWGRNDNSPGEDAFVNGEYGAQLVLGGQGALPNGTYPLGAFRKAITEMNGKYCGNRPMKLKKSSWKDRNKGVIKSKMRKNKTKSSWGFA